MQIPDHLSISFETTGGIDACVGEQQAHHSPLNLNNHSITNNRSDRSHDIALHLRHQLHDVLVADVVFDAGVCL
jgi:hypothetical protein